jgi:phospholysine phosphohistidine inorganic pyrophosphate phosphatase
VRATVVGKPAAPFFRAGFRALGLPPAAIVMAGDDLANDILPAMRLGAISALTRTGKFRDANLQTATPDIVLDSVAELPQLFENAV